MDSDATIKNSTWRFHACLLFDKDAKICKMPKVQLKKEIMKLTKIPHPNGRKTARLLKKTLKLEHRKKVKVAHNMKTNITAERYLWFQSQLEEADVCTPNLLLDACKRYLARFDDELEQISLKHEIGGKRKRQHANREDIIKMTQSNELEEFNTCGIEIPDVFITKQFQILKTWKGELRFMQNFKLKRFNRSSLESLIENGPALQDEADVAMDEESVSAESLISRTE